VTKEKSEQGYGQEGEEVEVAREATGREETRTFVETQDYPLSTKRFISPMKTISRTLALKDIFFYEKFEPKTP
jgi:hypothetical protein